MDEYVDVFEMQRSERSGVDLRGGTEQPSVLTVEDCRPLRLDTPEKVKEIFVRYVETSVQKEHITLFESHLLYRNDSWWVEVGDVGLVYLTDVKPTFTASLNMIFWDKKLPKDRREIVRALLQQAFDAFKLTRVQASTPETNGPFVTALRKIGMTQEGVLRGAWRESEADQNLVIFGLLKEEVSKWPQQTTSLAKVT